MRRLRILLPFALLLIGCAPQQGAQLPPEEVLKRAAQEGRNLQSAEFSVTASSEGVAGQPDSRLSGSAQGRLQDAGSQLQFTAAVQGTLPQGRDMANLQGTVNVIVAGENEVYVSIASLNTNPPHPLFSAPAFTQMFNQWWQLPASRQTGEPGMTPDPQLIGMQAQVVSVTKNKGLTTIDGRSAYDYEVTVDREKLLAYLEQVSKERQEEFQEKEWRAWLENMSMNGELWIDAETFVLHRLEWSVLSKSKSKPMNVSFRIDLRNHNRAEPVSPPADAKPFPLNPLEGFGFTAPNAGALPPQLQQQIVDPLLRPTP